MFLAWLAISSFIPGAAISISLFRRESAFSLIEKALIGFALGFFLLPMVPFLLYLVLGIKFSHEIALLSVAVLYAAAAASMLISRAYEDFVPRGMKLSLTADIVVPVLLIVLLVLTFMARFGSYSPVFQELDPYFYTYPAAQLLTLGENPFDDQTAWYPELEVNHRVVPAISYLESIWYSLYTGGAPYDNMLLAAIASMYPPVAAVLSVFFIYLFVSVITKREWGLAAAGLASFVPVFIFKLAGGEQEVQPYAFFALMFFYAMYALAFVRRDIRLPPGNGLDFGKDAIYPLLAGLAFMALSLGSSSQILAIASIIIFVMGASALIFIRDKDGALLRHLLIVNAAVFVLGPLLAGAVLKPFFLSGSLSLSFAVSGLVPVLFCGLLYALKTRLQFSDRMSSASALAAILILGFALYAATPLGDYVRNIGKSGFEIALYNAPLDRTIAEQGAAPSAFGGQMGFIAQSFYIPPAMDTLPNAFSMVMYALLAPATIIVNIALSLFVAVANLVLGTEVDFGDKDPSFMHLWLMLFGVACAYAAARFLKRDEDGIFLLMLAIVLPPLVVGLIKAKYTIYAGVLLAMAIGYTFGQAGDIIDRIFRGILKEETLRYAVYSLPLLLAFLAVALQFLHLGYAPSLIWGSTLTLYQNDPSALGAKFAAICAESGDADVCAAAADPSGYAARGTNYQYSSKLCMLSVFSDYATLSYMYDGDPSNDGMIPPHEATAASFRCQRLSEYWVDSMEWIKGNTEPGARITSWWDYGHWINYFGERNAVVRNEHASHAMIGDVAHGYLDATPEELRSWMQAHGTEYALFDYELVSSGGGLGGKYGALNYLSCARDNKTSVRFAPGESACEAEHLWESVIVSANPCTISPLTGKTGYTAYKMYAGDTYLPYYPDVCRAPADSNSIAYCRDYIRAVPAYCVGNATVASGQPQLATYYLNETNVNGDLKLNKAFLGLPYLLQTSSHFGQAYGFTLFYTRDPVWLENGEITDGYGDRKGKFYDSALYRAIFLDDLPGFTQVYSSPTGAVKIYRIAE